MALPWIPLPEMKPSHGTGGSANPPGGWANCLQSLKRSSLPLGLAPGMQLRHGGIASGWLLVCVSGPDQNLQITAGFDLGVTTMRS